MGRRNRTGDGRWRGRVVCVTVAVAMAGVAATACARDEPPSAPMGPAGSSPVVDPGDGGSYHPEIKPEDFVLEIDHPYLPLRAGASWIYEGVGDEGAPERVEVVVTSERRQAMGVSTVIVRDTVTSDGELVEDTFDCFAQDRAGNVWYFGEDVKDYEGGKLVSTAGSWEAGVDGALPGIVMPAQPVVGDAYRQEYLVGEAEDMAEVLAIDEARTTRLGEHIGVLVTEEWTPLEPDVVEQKSYAAGIGQILGVTTRGGEGSIELVAYTPAS